MALQAISPLGIPQDRLFFFQGILPSDSNAMARAIASGGMAVLSALSSSWAVGSVYALASSLLKRSCKRLAMGVGDSTCCAVVLKKPTSFSGMAFWLKGALFSAIL